MTNGSPGRLAELSLLDPQVQSDPAEFYKLLHEHMPVYRMPETGAYIVSRYADLRSVLLNPKDFSSTFGESFLELQGKEGIALYDSILAERGWNHMMALQRADEPLHTRHRRLVEGAFTGKRIKALTPQIEAQCNRLIDAFIDRGECEFVSEFALPFPGMIIADQLGLDPEQFGTFKRWADALLAPLMGMMSREDLIANAEAEVELQHYLAQIYAERQQSPGDDIISALASAGDGDHEPLTMVEFQSIMQQLIAGGFDTLTSGIAHALWLLLRFPEQMTKLRGNRGLLSNFIDEALRLESPAQGLMRRTTRDVELAGAVIPKDSVVIVRYGAANRDERHFGCPQIFDIERSNAATHLAFGNGIHFCIGRLLARQEMKTAFTMILDRMEDIELARALSDPPHLPSMMLRPLKELPIRFSKAR